MNDTSHWPAPLLQPQSHTGCMEHSVAYICHCLGHPDVTPQMALDWRAQTHKHESMYPSLGFGHHHMRFWDDYHADPEHELHKRYWMGPAHKSWVQEHLTQRHIALVQVLRIPTMGHVVVLLDSDGTNVLLMDPLYGFKEETWEWFLGSGAGNSSHHIDGWYWP